VREFCERAFAEVGLDYEQYVKIDERFLRPAEVDLLVGDAAKAREQLGWEPEYTFAEMIKEMVAADLEAASRHTER
jgi:GDPmannose 4,6-dehydratase